jgi:hypothetical protein
MSTLSQFFGGSSVVTTPCELLVVGGGAGGGNVSGPGSGVTAFGPGGGGGGVLASDSYDLPRGIAYAVVVGAGGSSGNFVAVAGSGSGLGQLVAGGGGTLRGCGSGIYRQSNNTAYSPAGMGAGCVLLSGASATAGVSVLSLLGSDGNANSGGSAAVTSSITGSSVTYGVGASSSSSPVSGAANTGNGGTGGQITGGSGGSSGASGGSGIVVIAYPDTYPAPAAISGTYTTPTRSGWRVYRFTGSGSITL